MTTPTTTPDPRPWGLSRMKPFPPTAVLTGATVVLDADRQVGRWIRPDGLDVPALDRHKRSQTCNESKTKTSLDSVPDEGTDQQGDED